MNICMVGYGAIAEKHMEALAKIDGVNPHVLVGRRQEPTGEFADQWGFRHHTLDLDAALADDQVDAVVIASPNEVHAVQAEKSLKAGKHLLLEIPIALNLADSRRITALSREVDRRLMVCHTWRYMPAIREVRRRVREGELHLHHIISFFGIQRKSNSSWTGKVRSWTDNILWHHAAHAVDLMIWVCGGQQAKDIHCRFGPPHPAQGTMDMHLTMRLNDTLASISQSYNISTFRLRWLFIGEEASLEYDMGTLYNTDGDVVVPHRGIVDLTDQNAEFVAAVREGRDTDITGEDILPTMEVLHAAQESADAALKNI